MNRGSRDIFTETLRNSFPEIEIVAVDGDTIDPSRAYEKVKKMVTDHPRIAGVFNTTAATVEQWNDIIMEKGLKDKLKVIVMDTLPRQLEYVQSGTIYGVISQGLFDEGYQALKALFSPKPIEYQYVGSEFVTKSDKELIQKYMDKNAAVKAIIDDYNKNS